MPTENSPSIDQFAQGMPPEPAPIAPARRRTRIIIGLLAAAVLVMFLITLLQSTFGAQIAGKGGIRGVVLDENGIPMQGVIMLFGQDVQQATQPDGTFTLSNLPAGEQVVIVSSFMGEWREFPVTVIAGQVVDMGALQFVSTLEPAP